MRWTADQEKAIYTDTGNGNILVSAAAGSGKTAVLVERVLQKILHGKSSIERLLIVTFTEAAASEMREKIVKRLYEYLSECGTEEKNFIKSQIRLTETAEIMTIDAFCKRVVENNFHALGISPDIRICDDGLAKLLMDDAINRVYDRIYKTGSDEEKSRFKRLTDFYAKDRSNEPLSELMKSLYKFTDSFAEPIKWLEENSEIFKRPVLEWPSVAYHMTITRESAKVCLSEMNDVLTNNECDETARAIALILKDITSAICAAENWDDIYEVYNTHLSNKKKLKPITELTAKLTDSPLNNKLMYAVYSFLDIFTPQNSSEKATLGITQSSEKIIGLYDTELLYEEVWDIVWLMKEIIREFAGVKENHSVYQFADIERLAYTLFRDCTEIREAYKNKYDEILIDEYQDTNMLQDTIFKLISRKNIFMVGDLKQSIYRFRKGDPYIFKSKAEKYEDMNTRHQRIILSQNFRSRNEILDSVNALFTKIMSLSAGDVDYSGGELIVRSKEFEVYPNSDFNEKSELHFLAIDRNSGINKDLYEAQFTAKKIDELLKSGVLVFDKSLGAMRPIQKRDIVVLQYSLKYNAEYLFDELSNLGIDSYVDATPFFDRREITVMLSLLSVINNTHQNIPLITVLRSPIGGFSDNDLALLHITDKNDEYYIDKLSAYTKTGKDDTLKRKCTDFLRHINRWRGYTRHKSVAQLIWAIYEESCFYDIMGAIDESEDSQANLRLLYERATQYEGAGFKGLFNFIKYIEELEQNDKDIGGAKTIGEANDVVRIMTIHRSKGLEFPYVFVLGTGRAFQSHSDTPIFSVHKDLGFGMPHIYYDKHYSKNTYAQDLITVINKKESMSEKMRLLYVALTRAREKLYVIACKFENADEEAITDKWRHMLVGGKMLPLQASTVKGFYEWLCPAVLSSLETWKFQFHSVNEEICSTDKKENATPETYSDSPELKDAVYKILNYTYPFSESNTIPSRTSVTQLKEMATAEETIYEPDSRRITDSSDMAEYVFAPLHQKPRFMDEEGYMPPNEIGTLYHSIMSRIDLDAVRNIGVDVIDAELKRMKDENIVSKNELTHIAPEKLKQFFKSDIGIRMLNAKNVYREQPFQINISALEYDGDLPQEYKNETVILQGIIDCYFEEADGYVLFDYKTDKVKDKNEIFKKYKKQLELYKMAIERLTSKPVKEYHLYLFDTNETV